MSEKVKRSFRNLFSRVKKATQDSIDTKQMEILGRFAVGLIVKRTRLGYGVERQLGTKKKLKGLSKPYKDYRATFSRLSKTTSKNKSNLTLTGQMLESINIIRAVEGKIFFGPTGQRDDTNLSNNQVAFYQEKQGRVFNRISELEYRQVLRQYRREFGDLLRKRRLIR